MNGVLIASGVMLGLGAILTMIRVEKGPTMLDRAVAFDIISNIVIIGVALDAAVELRTDIVPILAALALFGFVSSVTIARFVSVEPDEAGRIKTPEEVRAENEAQLRAEMAAARAEEEMAATRDQDGSR
jgi:multicomponent Na+:H+ antiporter subunit F